MAPRILASVVIHLASATVSFLAMGVVHVLSGRGLWGVLPMAHEVRQFSVYSLDALPFLIVAVVVVSALYRLIRGRDSVQFGAFFVVGLIAAGLAVLAHLPFFPTSARAVVYLAVMAILYVSVYPVVDRVFFGWRGLRLRFRTFPFVPELGAAVATGAAVCLVYVGVFRIAALAGYVVEHETYKPALVATPRRYQFIAGAATRPTTKPYRLGPPSPALFTAEELPIRGLPVRFVDLDGNGFVDVVTRNPEGVLELWINEDGRLSRHETFLNGVENSNIHDYYFADYDRDGKFDLLVSRFVGARKSNFRQSFLKKSFWYPFSDTTTEGRLYRQIGPGKWQDASARAFPGGAPRAFRKVEPILWFDANSDGLLDFVWSQYPHPRRALNRLYIQNGDGVFIDRMSEMIPAGAERVYAEGSDVADFDGDGDIDLFAYGYLLRNDGGRYVALCGEAMPGILCDAAGRNDEGGLFADVNGDGALDLVLSYHGVGATIPKYYLQLFLGDPEKPGRLRRIEALGRQFYGFNTYLRDQDFDFNGRADILTQTAGRLLSMDGERWVDLMPAITGAPSGVFHPAGWIDIDEDGDWDFIARRKSDSTMMLFRNGYNPRRYAKISAVGQGGVENQHGATLRINLPGGGRMVHAYRPMGGYAGVTDPRLILLIEPDFEYRIEACFPSMVEGAPEAPPAVAGVTFAVTGRSGNCVDYRFAVAPGIERVDLKLVAGPEGARIAAR